MYTSGHPDIGRGLILASPSPHRAGAVGGDFETWTHTTAGLFRLVGAHAVEFSKTAVPLGGDSSAGHARTSPLSVRARKYSALAQEAKARASSHPDCPSAGVQPSEDD